MQPNQAYNESIKALTSQGKFHISLGLERISKLMEILENPQNDLNIIHVAGTNGKGSTCAIIASILKSAGYKTGLYTSPHLIEYTERIKVNDIEISKDKFAEIILGIIDIADTNHIHITEFEILTAAAFKYFNEQKTDIVVLETGLGGRLDATNIVKPLLSVITTIDFDHTDRLGNSIEQIAIEKAGIIKENTEIITLKDNNGIETLKDIAQKRHSKIIMANYDDEISKKYFNLLSLKGSWQLKNLSLALSAIKLLKKMNYDICEKDIELGLKNVKWAGRFQYFQKENVLIDGAHNVSGATELIKSLDIYYKNNKKIWIYSSLNTKDYKNIVKILFKTEDKVICSKSSSPNAVSPRELKNEIIKFIPAKNIHTEDNIEKAFQLAKKLRTSNEMIIIAGSLYSIGSILKDLN